MSSEPENGTEFVRIVLEILSPKEVLALKYLMRKTKGWKNHEHTHDPTDNLESIRPEKLRRAIFSVCGVGYDTQTYALAIQLLPGVRSNLQRTHIPKTWERVDYASLLPPFEFQHPTIGTLIFSTHAQQRFMQRQLSGQVEQIPPEKRAEQTKRGLILALSRAHETKLKPAFEVERLINNGFKPATYLIDKVTGLRFVLNGNTPPTVVTVERPK